MAQRFRNKLKLKSSAESSSNLCTTPVKTQSVDNDYSPVYLPCTQESLDNVDVLWDWNSPQSKIHTSRRPKRVINHKSSPKLLIKKPLKSSNIHRSFDKIRDELLAFQEEIEPMMHLNDSELDLNSCINNNQVPEYIDPTANEVNKPYNELNDIFDDSLEQELIMVSQQVEEKLKSEEQVITKAVTAPAPSPANNKPLKTDSSRTLTKSFSSNMLFDSPIRMPNRSNFDCKGKRQQLNMNDSFGAVLEAFSEDFDVSGANPCVAAGSAASVTARNDSPLKFKKSLSFGHSYARKSNEEVLREEIEKKRLAALEKLKAKKVPAPTPAVIVSDSDSSPIKCSPEEIEIKRQQARAKLEQKKQQDLIQRNRLKALRKLEMRRRHRHIHESQH